jgi:hypothetical protein
MQTKILKFLSLEVIVKVAQGLDNVFIARLHSTPFLIGRWRSEIVEAVDVGTYHPY